MRFLAAAAVMVYHFTYEYARTRDGPITSLQAVTRHGYLGVEVFFMISGFVVLWSATGRSATMFVRARLLRLYPEFWLAVLISATIFTVVSGGFPAPDLRTLLVNLTMLPQYLRTDYVDGVYWTLGVEIKFYVLLWLLLIARQLESIERWLYLWIVASALAAVVDVGGIVRSVTIEPYGSLFAAGGLFFLVHSGGWTLARAVGIGVTFVLSAHHAVAGMTGFIDAEDITRTGRIVTGSVIGAAFVVFGTAGRVRLNPRARVWATTAGALTYPLYLLHNTGKELFLRTGEWAPEWLRVALATAFSIAVSLVVLRTAERFVKPPFRRAVDRLLGKHISNSTGSR